MIARRLVAPAIAMATLAAASCKATPPSELVLAFATDLAMPKDIDTITIDVVADGKPLLSQTYQVGGDATRIPATLGVVGNADTPGAPIRVRVVGRRGNEAKLLRTALTQVPKERTVLLRLPLHWLCWEQNTEPTPGDVRSTCPDGQTCLQGACVDETVDATTLADFDAAQVFGGGACFDTIGCMAAGAVVPVRTSDCSIAKPAGGATGLGINVAMTRKLGLPGICSGEACFIPLDADDALGWKDAGDRILLPPATCDRLALPDTEDTKITGVAVTTACPTKTPAIPTCGPWSSVGDDAGTPDAAPPDGTIVGVFDASAE